MKSAIKFLTLLFTVLILTNTAYAESPREQLKQMVEQLRANPDDDALRVKIIKLAHQLKPAPAIPEEAERRMVRGTAAFKGAKSVADYRDAAKEFEQATLAAPWYGDAYFNLGVAQDKSENYENALSSLKLALLALPNSKDIKALIYEVEYRKEKANSAVAAAEQRKQSEQKERRSAEELIRGLEGAIFAGQPEGYTADIKQAQFLRVSGGRIEGVNKQQRITINGSSYSKYCLCGDDTLCNAAIGAEKVCSRSGPFTGRVAEYREGDFGYRYEILDNGRELVLTTLVRGKTSSVDRFERQ